MGIGDFKAIDGRSITIHSSFGHGVNQLSTILVLGQAGEFVLPLTCFVQGNGINNLAACQQVDGDGSRALAVLVVVIVPNLGNGNRGIFQCIGQGACGRISGTAVVGTESNPRPVAGITEQHSIFCDGHTEIGGCAHTIDKAIIGDVGAAVGFCCIRSNDQFTLILSKRIHRPANIRSITLLGNDDGLGILSAGDIQRTTGLLALPFAAGRIIELNRGINCCGLIQHIVGYGFLFHGKLHTNRVSAGAGNTIGNIEGPGPIGTGDGLRGNLHTISQQVNSDGGGANTAGILIVIPDLLTGDVDLTELLVEFLVGHIGIRDGVAIDLLLIADRNRDFINSIVDFCLTCLIFIQIAPGVGPLICIIHSNRIAQCNPVSIELELHISRTSAQAVLIVFPNLGSSYFGFDDLFVSIGNGQGCFTQRAADNAFRGKGNGIGISSGQNVFLAGDGNTLVSALFGDFVGAGHNIGVSLGVGTAKGCGLICSVILQNIDGVVLLCRKTSNDLLNIQLDGSPLGNQLNMGDQANIHTFTDQVCSFTVYVGELITASAVVIISSLPTSEVVTLFCCRQFCSFAHSIGNMLPAADLCFCGVRIHKLGIGGLVTTAVTVNIGTACNSPLVAVCKRRGAQVATHDSTNGTIVVSNVQRLRNRRNFDQDKVLRTTIGRIVVAAGTMTKRAGRQGRIQRAA